MNTIYKSIFITMLAITANTATATEFEIDKVVTNNLEKAVEPRLQLTLFPGIARAPKTNTVLHMAEQPRDVEGVLNLNSSLNGESQQLTSKQYLDDIQVTTNNILEIRF